MDTSILAAILLQYGCIAASFTFQRTPIQRTGLSRMLSSNGFIGISFTILSVVGGLISTILLIWNLGFIWGIGAFLLIGFVGGIFAKIFDRGGYDWLSLSSLASLLAGFSIIVFSFLL